MIIPSASETRTILTFDIFIFFRAQLINIRISAVAGHKMWLGDNMSQPLPEI